MPVVKKAGLDPTDIKLAKTVEKVVASQVQSHLATKNLFKH